MKIALEPAGNIWRGGITYPKAVFHALQETYGDEIALYFLCRNIEPDEELRNLRAKVLNIKLPRDWTATWAIQQAMSHFLSYDLLGTLVMKQHGIDVMFGALLSHRYSKIPTLSWIPDFQHIHLPQMFSPQERDYRDRTFLRSASVCSRIILMSECVRRDFESFAPQHADKVRVIKAVGCPPESIYYADPRFVTKLYDLPEKFLYLPNQFWKHKNHELVFKAIRLLKERGVKTFLVCSGYAGDYRHPWHFLDLLTKLSVWGIRNEVAVVFSLEREHVFSFMRQAVCVLNPSLFEGFGLTVSEAASVGKRVLLSDIAAHREQDPPKATFFDPHSCEDLAQKLSEIWREGDPGPDLQLEREARRNAPKLRRASAESFMSVLREVTGES